MSKKKKQQHHSHRIRSRVVSSNDRKKFETDKFSSNVRPWILLKDSPNFQAWSADQNKSFYPSSATNSPKSSSNQYRKKSTNRCFERCSFARITCITFIIALILIGIAFIICLPILLTRKSATTTASTTTQINFQWRWNSSGTTVLGNSNSTTTSANELHYPIGIVLYSSNTIYIADQGNQRVQKWSIGSSNASTVAGQANGTVNAALNTLHSPSDIAVDRNGNVYAIEQGFHRVVLWTVGATNGIVVAGNGTAGNDSNLLNTPVGLSLDLNSNILYVADTGNHRIMKYLSNSSTGILVAGGNGRGYSQTQLFSPLGIYFDSLSNSLFIANCGANNIVRWFLGTSSWILVAGSASGLLGNTSLLLYNPTDVTIDSMGNIYVADTFNHRIQFFSSGQMNGTTIAGVTSTTGSTANLLNYPYSVAVDSQFNLYVSDTLNSRLQEFKRY